MQKHATPTKEQKYFIRVNGLNPLTWTVLKEFGHDLLVRNRVTGEVRMIHKPNQGK